MSIQSQTNPETFYFRDLHPQVCLGTASDRYAGWVGQIYSKNRYEGRISKRSKVIGGKPFIEEILPVESVEEYFEHFSVLEIDFTFYRPLLGPDGASTPSYQVLKNYHAYLKPRDRIILKVPQIITAHKIGHGEEYARNEAYLNPKIFTQQFYEPAIELLGSNLTGFVFEQEYQRREDRIPLTDTSDIFPQAHKDLRFIEPSNYNTRHLCKGLFAQ